MFTTSSSENYNCSHERTTVLLTHIRVLRITVLSDSGNGRYFKRHVRIQWGGGGIGGPDPPGKSQVK